ncbi:MAG: class I SAM-dependent methyltransferase [Planctomycetes bacterium]|nr:class I SAM-dependent methyltransferase [Planctomycetota bacterium]
MDRRERLADLFLRIDGLGPELVRTVDPGDEMLRTIERHAQNRDETLCSYFRTGRDALLLLEHVQATLGRPLTELDAVLDFACGWGRVARWLRARLGRDRVFGSDIAPASLAFCSDALGIGTFLSALDPAELRFPRAFDLIFVGSLFTHLPRPRFESWLRALLGALTPDGSLVFTTHGEERMPPGSDGGSGFAFVESTPIDYLPVSEYGTTFVQRDALRALAAHCGATQLASRARALWWYHDVHVARRERSPRLDDALPPVPLVQGRFHSVTETAPGHGRAIGFAAVHREHGPLTEVLLRLDGEDLGRAVLGEPRALDANCEPAADHEWCEFYAEGDLRRFGAGEHLLAAIGRSAGSPARALDVAPLTLSPA